MSSKLSATSTTIPLINSLVNYESKQMDALGNVTVTGKLITTNFDLVEKKSTFNFWRWLTGKFKPVNVSKNINAFFEDKTNESALKKCSIQDLTKAQDSLEILDVKFSCINHCASLSKSIQIISRIIGSKRSASSHTTASSAPNSRPSPAQPIIIPSSQSASSSSSTKPSFRVQSGDRNKDAAQDGVVNAISRNGHSIKTSYSTHKEFIADAASWNRNNTASEAERAKRGPVPAHSRDPITGRIFRVAVPAADENNPFAYKRPVLVPTSEQTVVREQVTSVDTRDVGARLRETSLRRT